MFLKIFLEIWADFQTTGKLLVNNRKKIQSRDLNCQPGLRFALLNLEDCWINHQKCSMSNKI